METIIYSLYLSKLEQLQQFERRITTPPFAIMLTIAFSLHIIAILVIGYMLPKPTAIPVPVRELTLHLGGGKDIANKIDDHNMAQRMASALQGMTSQPEKKDQAPEISTTSPPTKTLDTSTTKPKEMKKKNTPSTRVIASAPKIVKIDKILAQQTTKNEATVDIAGTASPDNGSSSVMDKIRTQEMMLRYEQKLSAWINRYKVYPSDAFKRGLQGNVVLRIRIDRAGYIKFILIQESSGYDILDQAVIDAAKKANPVPVVPTDYPGGQLLEFLIPVKFALK